MKNEIAQLIIDTDVLSWYKNKTTLFDIISGHYCVMDKELNVWTLSHTRKIYKISFFEIEYLIKPRLISSFDISGLQRNQSLILPGLELKGFLNLNEMENFKYTRKYDQIYQYYKQYYNPLDNLIEKDKLENNIIKLTQYAKKNNFLILRK